LVGDTVAFMVVSHTYKGPIIYSWGLPPADFLPTCHPSPSSLLVVLALALAAVTYAWKAALGVRPGPSSAGKLPMLVCMGKVLLLLAGCGTADRLTAQAKVLTSVGLRPLGEPRHLLHPVQSTSTVQCVAFLDEPSVTSLASPYAAGTVRPLCSERVWSASGLPGALLSTTWEEMRSRTGGRCGG